MLFLTLTEATKVNDHCKISFKSYHLETDEIEVFVEQKGKWPDKTITNQISKIFMKIPGRSAMADKLCMALHRIFPYKSNIFTKSIVFYRKKKIIWKLKCWVICPSSFFWITRILYHRKSSVFDIAFYCSWYETVTQLTHEHRERVSYDMHRWLTFIVGVGFNTRVAD